MNLSTEPCRVDFICNQTDWIHVTTPATTLGVTLSVVASNATPDATAERTIGATALVLASVVCLAVALLYRRRRKTEYSAPAETYAA